MRGGRAIEEQYVTLTLPSEGPTLHNGHQMRVQVCYRGHQHGGGTASTPDAGELIVGAEFVLFGYSHAPAAPPPPPTTAGTSSSVPREPLRLPLASRGDSERRVVRSADSDGGRSSGNTSGRSDDDPSDSNPDDDMDSWPADGVAELAHIQKRVLTQQELMQAAQKRGRAVLSRRATRAADAPPEMASDHSQSQDEGDGGRGSNGDGPDADGGGAGEDDGGGTGTDATPGSGVDRSRPAKRLASMLHVPLPVGAFFFTAEQFCRALFALMRAVHTVASLDGDSRDESDTGDVPTSVWDVAAPSTGYAKPGSRRVSFQGTVAWACACVVTVALTVCDSRYSLLHYAASVGCLDVVRRLLAAGANRNAVSPDGTAAEIALASGYPRIYRALKATTRASRKRSRSGARWRAGEGSGATAGGGRTVQEPAREDELLAQSAKGEVAGPLTATSS